MANVFDNAVKGYTIGLNNKINAQKAYINSYLDGINARNAVNQEGRTQDQYYNYTQPLQASNLGVIVGQNNIQQRILNDPNYQDDSFGLVTSKARMANKLATADLNNIGYYIDTQGNIAKTGTAKSGYNLKNANFDLSQQDEINKQKALDIAHSGEMQPIRNKTELEQAQQYYNGQNNTAFIDGVPTTTQIFGENPNGTPATIMLPNGGTPSMDNIYNYWTSKYLNPKVTTPASGLPSNPSNTQQTGQQQVPTGYENKYQHDERIRKENILKSIDKYQKLLDHAIQNRKISDITKYAGLIRSSKELLNSKWSNLYDFFANNKSEADFNYELKQKQLLGQ